jgi:hypothetical protein
MTGQLVLRRYWIKFADDSHVSPMGYGVTAWTSDDALAILKAKVFANDHLPHSPAITADINISTLDARHIRPNMSSPNWRGIWYPLGFADNS